MLVRAASSILSWGWGTSFGLSASLLILEASEAAEDTCWARRAFSLRATDAGAATCSQCSARREAAPTASVLKTPLPEVALASLDFTSFSFVWHCFSFNAKFSIVEDVELNYQLFSDIKAQTKYQNHNKISFYVKSLLSNQILQSECLNSYTYIHLYLW